MLFLPLPQMPGPGRAGSEVPGQAGPQGYRGGSSTVGLNGRECPPADWVEPSFSAPRLVGREGVHLTLLGRPADRGSVRRRDFSFGVPRQRGVLVEQSWNSLAR